MFTPGQPLAPGLLTVLEQMPGVIVWSDHTPHLLTPQQGGEGYWASYNRISVPELFTLTNQTALVLEYGPHFSYNGTSRAVIFRREQAGVVDEASLAKLMRYNEFQTDPEGPQGCTNGASASNAIAERGDLTPANAGCLPGIGQHDEVRRREQAGAGRG